MIEIADNTTSNKVKITENDVLDENLGITFSP